VKSSESTAQGDSEEKAENRGNGQTNAQHDRRRDDRHAPKRDKSEKVLRAAAPRFPHRSEIAGGRPICP
jgi:hypothetical protein